MEEKKLVNIQNQLKEIQTRNQYQNELKKIQTRRQYQDALREISPRAPTTVALPFRPDPISATPTFRAMNPNPIHLGPTPPSGPTATPTIRYNPSGIKTVNPLFNLGRTTPIGRPNPPPYKQMNIPVYYQKSIPYASKGSPQFNNAYNNATKWMNRQIERGKLSPNCQIAVQGDGRRTYFTVTEPTARGFR